MEDMDGAAMAMNGSRKLIGTWETRPLDHGLTSQKHWEREETKASSPRASERSEMERGRWLTLGGSRITAALRLQLGELWQGKKCSTGAATMGLASPFIEARHGRSHDARVGAG
jgi:hypothetical protein